MKKILLLLLIISVIETNAQTCAVNVDALKGTFTGDCKDNKANGRGTAKGEDEYTGEFKNGYPEGEGVYKWKNGDWYEGSFKKGKKEGQGVLHSPQTADSLVKGFWKKDKYVGLYEKPFLIRDRTTQITQVDLRNQNDGTLKIEFNIESISGGSTGASGIVPKVTITEINILTGGYGSIVRQDHLAKTSIATLRNVVYPFRAKIFLGQDNMDLEILEPGNWTIGIKIQR